MSYSQSKTDLFKDTYNKKIAGVCAGIAHYLGLSLLLVRILTVIAFIALPVVIGVAYIVAALLLPNKPQYINHQ